MLQARKNGKKRTVQEAKKIAEIKAYKKGKNWYWHMEVGNSI